MFAGSAVAQNVVSVTATEYKFQAPDSIPAGVTTFDLVAKGSELHHMQIVRFEDGKTFADFQAALHHGPPPSWVSWVGGPNGPIPDGLHKATVTLALSPGNYALICFIPSPSDMKPHMAKGMMHPFKVTAGRAGVVQAGLPKADYVMTLYDYNFDVDKEMTAGRKNILIKNTAKQFHEVVFAKLPPGVPVTAFNEWVDNGLKGPPPVIPAGGIVGINPGVENVLTIDLEPGDYGLYCFLPAPDGKEHIHHGMFKKITVSR